MDEQRRKFIVEDEHYHRITVRRRHVFEDALVALRRGFPFDRHLAVTFLGEPAVDAGGPCREFFRLLTQEVFMKKSYFCGDKGSRVPTHNVTALEKRTFLYIGMA